MPVCELCQQERELRDSHIVPKFVYRYLKETSATGYLRRVSDPNRRIQDGTKRPLLCDACEQRLSAWERSFATHVYHPYRADQTVVAEYGPWMAKFVVSVVWRVLRYFALEGELGEVPARYGPALDAAAAAWRAFLLDERPHPGPYDAHVLPLGVIEAAEVPQLPTNIHAYMLRAVDMDVVWGERTALVYAKLPWFALIGIVKASGPRNAWQGTRVALRAGNVRPREYTVPHDVMAYILDQARQVREQTAELSQSQRAVVDRATQSNLQRAAASESLKAQLYDAQLFGLAALDADAEMAEDGGPLAQSAGE